MRRRGIAVAGSALALALALAPPSGAATNVGRTFIPDESCPPNTTFLMSGVPGFTVPSDGVITSWSYQAAATFVPTALKLKMARRAGGNDFTVVGESDPESPSASRLNTFLTRIPVLSGDILGMHTLSPDNRFCGHTLISTTYHKLQNADTPPGTTATFAPDADFELDLAATLEPDADRDGYGDETQDACPADGALHDLPCDRVSPDTTITARPKPKTKKKKATFAFSGIDARALAGFECALDSAAFTACTSPQTVRVRRGRHTFSVRARDQDGNVDGSPATVAWKVKKKKKKQK